MKVQKIKKIIFSLVFVSLISTLLISANAQAAEEIMIGGGRHGGTGFIFYTAATNVLNKYIKDYFFSVTTTGGAPENIIRIEKGDLKMGLISLVDAIEVLKTKDLSKHRIRVLHTGTCAAFQLLVPRDSPAKSIYDLKGERVSVDRKGGPLHAAISTLLDALSLSFTYFEPRYMGAADSTAAFKDGVLDAILTAGALPTPAVLEPMISPRGGKILSFGDEDIRKTVSKYSHFSKMAVPSGTYEKQNYDVTTIGWWYFLGVRDDFPVDLGYRIGKVLTEHHDEVIQNYSGAKYSPPKSAVTERGTLLLHSGAEKYFREAGMLK